MSDAVLDGLGFERAVAGYGKAILTGGFVVSLLIVLGATWLAPQIVPFLPLAIVALAGAWLVFKHPALNLCVLISLFPLVADFEEGIEIKEVLFGIYLAAFLGHWYFRRIFLEREKLLRLGDDYLLAAILGMVVLYVPISLVFQATPSALVAQVIGLVALAVYFPAKSAVEDNPRNIYAILIALLVVGLFVTARNLFWMQQLVEEARQAWQITQKARVISNEILLVVPASAMLAWIVHLPRWYRKGPVLFGFLAMMLALIITQSRGFWIAFAFGCVIMLTRLERKERGEIILIGFVSLVISLVFVFFFFKETALLLFAGMFNRILSLGTAVTKDVSLINRLLEGAVVWDRFLENPILGHGLGVSYKYFNITILGTRDSSFIHNGYLALLYRFGLIGTTLFLAFWGRAIYFAARLSRQRLGQWYRIGALASLTVLSSLTLSNLTSNAFFHMDSLFMFGLMTGIIAGIRQRCTQRTVEERL